MLIPYFDFDGRAVLSFGWLWERPDFGTVLHDYDAIETGMAEVAFWELFSSIISITADGIYRRAP